jgi:glycosyltransferase involved in cell wall biosynthesis
MRNRPLLSIVTVCFRDVDNLSSTFESIAKVKNEGTEYVVIDGNSNDGTNELVALHDGLVDIYVSEKDNGVFDAMNKGIRKSSGKWVVFMNAGDCIAKAEEFISIDLRRFDSAGLVYGNTVYSGKGERKPFPEASLKYGLIMACHQSMFFNRDVLRDDVFYSSKFKLFNEYDLVCRMVRKKYEIVYLDISVAFFLGGGISSVPSWDARKARYYYVMKHFGVVGLFLTVLESVGVLSLPKRID